eukprot:NODE_25697_length_578_cov_2.356984.p5 GENE.NODE_25697_length_578_cov_2.356984~~NODE_25697_length_578_cov_2.356984.p5  ORF type:complete len:62 (-),score=36.71 NODE_25697_length_578_cov_2.356984:107-292(-)
MVGAAALKSRKPVWCTRSAMAAFAGINMMWNNNHHLKGSALSPKKKKKKKKKKKNKRKNKN